MSKQTIYPPDLDDLLANLKNEIFATMNCIQMGQINTYNKAEQSATIQLQVKRRIRDTEIKSYPLLVDCPVIFLQGGGAFLDFPIAKGDFCLVFFNDRDIDDWWTSANVKEPLTTRKHNLADGFALVGINPKINVLALDGTKVVLNTNNKDFNIEGGTGTTNIKSSKVNIGGDATLTQAILKGNAMLAELIIAFNAHTHPTAGTGLPSPPTTLWIEGINFPNAKSINNKTS